MIQTSAKTVVQMFPSQATCFSEAKEELMDILPLNAWKFGRIDLVEGQYYIGTEMTPAEAKYFGLTWTTSRSKWNLLRSGSHWYLRDSLRCPDFTLYNFSINESTAEIWLTQLEARKN